MSSIIFSCMHFCVNPRKVGERYQLLIVVMIYWTELGNFWNRACSGQPGVRGVTARGNRLFINTVLLDFAYRGSMERLASRLWRMEKYASPLLPLARQGLMGKTA